MSSMRAIFLAVLAQALLAPGAGAGDAPQALPDFGLPSVKISDLPKLADCAIPPVPPPTDTGYYPRARRVDSAITVRVDGKEGRADIRLPKAEGGRRADGGTEVFVRYRAPVLSWAAVLCSGGRYLGYKGSSLKLPDERGSFEIKDEALAFGEQRVRLARTHPWLAARAGGAPESLDRLCSGRRPKLKPDSPEALPAEADGFFFSYDRAQNSLTVTWGVPR